MARWTNGELNSQNTVGVANMFKSFDLPGSAGGSGGPLGSANGSDHESAKVSTDIEPPGDVVSLDDTDHLRSRHPKVSPQVKPPGAASGVDVEEQVEWGGWDVQDSAGSVVSAEVVISAVVEM